jgi:hypothetical protein
MGFYIPTKGPACWRGLLADPNKQWKTGYSAKALANCWESAAGVPRELQALFEVPPLLLIGIPEHKVDLPGGKRPSQSDLFAILRVGDKTIACTIEGKVDETFGPTIGEWLRDDSEGKVERLSFLCKELGLRQPLPQELRYQLLHRAVSAVVESDRFKTDEAAMIVHSFSQKSAWFEDFAAFCRLFDAVAKRDGLVAVRLPGGKTLKLGWASGDQKFLSDTV